MSNKKDNQNSTSDKENKPMKNRMLRFPDDTWEQAKAKAGMRPLSAVVRRLVEMWLDGKIDLED